VLSGADQAKLLEVFEILADGFGDLCRCVGADMDRFRAGVGGMFELAKCVMAVGGIGRNEGIVSTDTIAAAGWNRHGVGGEFASEQGECLFGWSLIRQSVRVTWGNDSNMERGDKGKGPLLVRNLYFPDGRGAILVRL
jgi:hypothetical protein